jgi:tRNA (Thr-GGU) A37 N-methylase
LKNRGVFAIEIANVDIIDGTPLIDIKPYVPEMDAPENCKIGWLTNPTFALFSS